jgi:hypothetical protein
LHAGHIENIAIIAVNASFYTAASAIWKFEFAVIYAVSIYIQLIAFPALIAEIVVEAFPA